MHVFVLKDGKVKKKQATVALIKKLKARRLRFWLDVVNPSKDEIKGIASIFKLHSLVIEDLHKRNLRPKVKLHERYMYMVMYSLTFKKKERKIMSKEIDFLLGKNYLITFRNGASTELDIFKKDANELKNYMLKGFDFLLYKFADEVTDNYFTVLECFEDQLSNVEVNMVSDTSQKRLNSIFAIRRELAKTRKIVYPQREMMNHIGKHNNDFITEGNELFFHDVADHLIMVSEEIDTHREILASAMELHLSANSNKMNEIMKVLTIFASVMLPLTFISSLYGMNFKFMPEIHTAWGYYWGYPTVLICMVLIVVAMLLYFRKKKWM